MSERSETRRGFAWYVFLGVLAVFLVGVGWLGVTSLLGVME